MFPNQQSAEYHESRLVSYCIEDALKFKLAQNAYVRDCNLAHEYKVNDYKW